MVGPEEKEDGEDQEELPEVEAEGGDDMAVQEGSTTPGDQRHQAWTDDGDSKNQAEMGEGGGGALDTARRKREGGGRRDGDPAAGKTRGKADQDVGKTTGKSTGSANDPRPLVQAGA